MILAEKLQKLLDNTYYIYSIDDENAISGGKYTMLIFKIMCLATILIICMGIGFNISAKYTSRVNGLKKMLRALNIFEEKIKFTYEPIPNIFEELGDNFSNSKNENRVLFKNNDYVGEIFSRASLNMKTMHAGEAWENAIDSVNTNFSKEDINIIKGLAKMLGKTDLDGQVSEIRLTKQFINTKIEEAEIEKQKNSKLYKTLGATIGLATVILLI